MEYFVVTFRFYFPKKTEIVFQMLNHIHNENEIVEDIFLLPDVRQFKLKPFIRSTFGKFKGLWRDIISPKHAFIFHVFLQLFQYLSGSTSYFADGSRRNLILPHHSDNL